MTVQNVIPTIQYTANGAQTSFAFNFRADNVTQVIVDFTDNLTGISLNIDQDSSPGGTADYSVAPPLNQVINIVRDTDVVQNLDYTRYDPFDSESHEDALDKLTMIIQELLIGSAPSLSDLQSQIDDINATIDAALAWEFVPFTGNRTLILSDGFKMLQSTDNGGTQDVTIPPNTDVAFVKGIQISFEQKGTSVLGFIEGSGVNIDTPAALTIAAQFGTVTLIQDEIDNWVLLGNIST